MPRRFFHYVCALLLLLAQQTALVHAAWHALGHDSVHSSEAHEPHESHEGHADHEAPAGQASLCAFDLAFGQVLGGAHGTGAPQLAVVPPSSPVVQALNPRLSAEVIPALSRGPPVLL